MATEKKAQKPSAERNRTERTGAPAHQGASPADGAAPKPTLSENLVMTLKVLAVAAAVIGLIWLLDRGVS